MRMRHDYSFLFSVAALGLVFSCQQIPASNAPPRPSTADVVPTEQGTDSERIERMSGAAARRQKQEGNEQMGDGRPAITGELRA